MTHFIETPMKSVGYLYSYNEFKIMGVTWQKIYDYLLKDYNRYIGFKN